MSLQSMLDAAAQGSEVTVDEGWGQGRATYGGLVGALGLARMEAIADLGDHRLKSVTVSFVGPLAPGAATIEAQVLRQGSSVTQTSASIVQDGQVATGLLASFGADRESAITVAPDAAMDLRPVDECEEIPHIPGITPDFFAHVALRVNDGSMPFSGAPRPDFSGWMRFREELTSFGDAHLFGLVDAWPPSVLPMAKGVINASSLTWTMQLLPHERPEDPNAWWGYRVRTMEASSGYCFSEARVYTPSGQLAALSHQSIAVFG